ncbi:MAG: hypothetical protein ACI9XO_004971 [Paraglaciecola sp.]|jgi:hypothetical protein
MLIVACYKKVPQGQALIRTGASGTQVAFDSGIYGLSSYSHGRTDGFIC